MVKEDFDALLKSDNVLGKFLKDAFSKFIKGRSDAKFDETDPHWKDLRNFQIHLRAAEIDSKGLSTSALNDMQTHISGSEKKQDVSKMTPE